ncbi:isoleucine--tRNA ligase [Williamsoniiplasma luminosum]|uniref:Isoleucine--tRNA ligase n=1 Tax=Williamsoniiplasma luminosum TaxID=214888 RepID=A0A2S0NJ36_9MOLU|nr:isoleucine--tRNA ligase [Williamsoniiplasma luminosum]AVP49028.1 MAG: isoleucine--tRNA ligase [Williamsoniiplasma luminosum]
MNNKYKETLLLGSTSFDMRASLKDKEPSFEKFWEENNIYQQKIMSNKAKPLFMLHDGPPYANGDLHIGHALNKSLKDFIIRWKNASGYHAPFIMGWDTHGLPIETAVAKTGVDRKTMDSASFRELCQKYALGQIENQISQFKRLGMFTDYENKYLTLMPDYEISELKLFAKMFNDGLIYKALKPIYWSPSSESALAESEIEYRDVKSPTIFVATKIVGVSKLPKNTHLVIWTTTPWTIPSNQLIAVGEHMDYAIVKPENDDRHFIIASSLVEKVAEQIGWTNVQTLDHVQGTDLINLEYEHPWYADKISKIVAGHHVTDEAGTGIVHIAGGFGEDDYMIAKSHSIEPFAPIDNQGKFTAEIMDQRLEGLFYEDANKVIGMHLQEMNKLLKLKFVTHPYPHDWRTKKPVIYRATLQWFVGLNKAKDKILKHVNQIETRPKWAKERLYQVLDDRTDWTISRQRLWGVPILGFYDQKDELVLNQEILNHTISTIEKLGINAWFSEPADTFLPSAYQGQGLKKEKDILDVWFDSGSSAIALEERFPEFKRPYDIYLEGNDQYRGWFNASMINSVVYDDKSPYKTLISHGMTTDEKGGKMSKSLGNGIDPIEFSNTSGADILRLWVASTDYTDDQKIGPEIIKQVSETYRKIRNTIRFILANLADFNPEKDYQKDLSSVDKYSLHNTTIFKNAAFKAYDNYQFNAVYNLTINFVTKDLSSFYLDFIKDILYVEGKNSVRRKQVQIVLFEQLWALIDVLRPILVHTIEEVYQNLPWTKNELSVHLLDNKVLNKLESDSFIETWNQILDLKNDVNKALEEAKNNQIVSKSFEALVELELKDDYQNLLDFIDVQDLSQIFIVSKIELKTKSNDFVEYKNSWINIKPRNGEKCQRCWAIFETLKNNELCERCFEVVDQNQGAICD